MDAKAGRNLETFPLESPHAFFSEPAEAAKSATEPTRQLTEPQRAIRRFFLLQTMCKRFLVAALFRSTTFHATATGKTRFLP